MASSSGTSWAPNTWFANNTTEQNGTFQVLATGTQDLAALVALFVTGSVERFAFDCNNGLLAAAVSPCSLLGILGYCQGLMKLALGFELCESLGFKADALRSHFGYLRSEVEYLPRSEYVAVHHLTRSARSVAVPQSPGLKQTLPDIWDSALVQWQTSRTVFHTNTSWALAKGCWHKRKAVNLGRSKQHAFVMCILRPTKLGVWFTIVSYTVVAFSFSLLSSSIILFADHNWTWSRIIATFGLARGVGLSFLLWMVVYVREQIPQYPCEWFESEWCPWPNEAVKHELSLRPKLGDGRMPKCSFFKQAGTFYLLTTSILTSTEKHLVRLCSFALAMLIMLGYICQYAELRKISSQGAAVWLICQLSLAGFRVLVWTASSRIHILKNHCLKDFTFYWPLDESLSTSSLDFHWSMTEIELVCMAIDQQPLFPSDGGTRPTGQYTYEESDEALRLYYSMHWLMGHVCAMFEAPRHLVLPVWRYTPVNPDGYEAYLNCMRGLTKCANMKPCDPTIKLWMTHRCDSGLSDLFRRLENSTVLIEPWLFFETMPDFRIAFCLSTIVLGGIYNDNVTAADHVVLALFALVSDDPNEVVVLLRHGAHQSSRTWLTRSAVRPQDVSSCTKCLEAAEKVFDGHFLKSLMVHWNCFVEEACTWRLANPHVPRVVDWALKEVETRWRECNADPSQRDSYYPYSLQEVMKRHGVVSNVRSFTADQSPLEKVQNVFNEINRRAAVRWKTLSRRGSVSRNARMNAIGNS